VLVLDATTGKARGRRRRGRGQADSFEPGHRQVSFSIGDDDAEDAHARGLAARAPARTDAPA
jgi:hypothetical protein